MCFFFGFLVGFPCGLGVFVLIGVLASRSNAAQNNTDVEEPSMRRVPTSRRVVSAEVPDGSYNRRSFHFEPDRHGWTSWDQNPTRIEPIVGWNPTSNPPAADETDYRSRSGRSVYRFRIKPNLDCGYRIYIVSHPDYGPRSTGSHDTHRLRDERGSYICWAGRLESVEQAKKVAARWADNTEDYIRHGRGF